MQNKHTFFSFLGIPTFGEGGDPVGTKSQLNPKFFSTDSPKGKIPTGQICSTSFALIFLHAATSAADLIVVGVPRGVILAAL